MFVPKVSIGLPVYNGEKYLSEAIDSFIAQTFTDWELVICDNASTDGTERICRDYAAKDSRIVYHRNERNIGPAGNYNLSFNLSRGQYFKWSAHDDMCAPDYLDKCVRALEADPSLVVVYPRTVVVDDHGRTLYYYNFKPRTDADSPARRYWELIAVDHRMHRAVEIFGLMRRSALLKTPLQGVYARGDSVLLVRMALLGRFLELPDYLFLSRHHASQSMQTLPSEAKRRGFRLSKYLGVGPLPPPEWWDSKLKGKVVWPEWRIMKEYFVSIGRAGLSPGEAMGCYAAFVGWLFKHSFKLGRDVAFAIEKILKRTMGSGDTDGSRPASRSVAEQGV